MDVQPVGSGTVSLPGNPFVMQEKQHLHSGPILFDHSHLTLIPICSPGWRKSEKETKKERKKEHEEKVF